MGPIRRRKGSQTPPLREPVLVTAGILCDGARVLACQRKAAERFGLKWEFPGGKLEPGETPEACLARELEEELGIQAEIGPEVHRTDHTYPNGFAVRLFFFQVPRYAGTPQNLAFERLSWVLPGDLPAYDFLDADRPVVERLARGEVTIA